MLGNGLGAVIRMSTPAASAAPRMATAMQTQSIIEASKVMKTAAASQSPECSGNRSWGLVRWATAVIVLASIRVIEHQHRMTAASIVASGPSRETRHRTQGIPP